MSFIYDLTMEVDLVISYVNNNDEIWKKAFVDYCVQINARQLIGKMASNRYGGVSWINYQLKLVKKNMPFIRKVFLLVSNIEQIKGLELNDNVEIVLHKNFIPFRFLPTFNSTTIEMYLPFIKGISEYFIYANDDMLPTRLLKESDFFDNEKIKMNYIVEETIAITSQFKLQCLNVYKDILDNVKKEKVNKLVRPYHTMTPMIKSHSIECFNTISKQIEKRVTRFRNDRNYNQYIYPIYEYIKYGTCNSNIDFEYTELKTPIDLNHDIVCVNAERNINYVKQALKELDKLCE